MHTRILSSIVLGLFVACVSTTLGGDDAAVKQDLKALQSTWRITSAERDGKPLERMIGQKLTIKGEDFIVRDDGKEVFKATIKLRPQEKPKALDIKITEGNDAGMTALGIYALEVDTLRFCVAKPGTEIRPKDFTTQDGSDRMVVMLQREKK